MKAHSEDDQRIMIILLGFKLMLIPLYLFLTFFCGLIHVNNVLVNDIKTQSWEYGRVSLIASYWYEHYEPDKLLKWYKDNIDEPLLIKTCDKAATPLYVKKHRIDIVGNLSSGDDIYLLSAYSECNLSESRINEDLQWLNIYRVKVR